MSTPQRSLASRLGVSIAAPTRPAAAPKLSEWGIAISASGTRLQWPLIWHDPPLYRLPVEPALDVAQQVASYGIGVAALRCEVGSVDFPMRICPYRPDRFGIQPVDLDASVIDLRLTAPFHSDYATQYSPKQLLRWGTLPDRIANNNRLDAPHWPADIRTSAEIAGKVEQLRSLSASLASIWATVCVASVSELADELVAAKLDGVMLQSKFDDSSLLPAAISTLKKAAAKAGQTLIVGVVADFQSTADWMVCLALGADVVAIDSLIDRFIVEPLTKPVPVESTYMFSPPPPMVAPQIELRGLIQRWIDDLVSQTIAHGASSPKDSHLSKVLRRR